MKRILFSLIMLVATASATMAITPREAFNRSETSTVPIDPSRGYALKNEQKVTAFTGSNNLDLQIIDIASQITPEYRLIGAYNPEISAEVYTCPDATGQYDYLLLVYGRDGALYSCQSATIDEGTRNLIAQGSVYLQGKVTKIKILPDANLVNIR